MQESEIIEDPSAGMTSEGRKRQIRRTTPHMTKYERTRILGLRALQISNNAPVMVPVEKETDPLKIATKELVAGKVPFIIRRRLPNGTFEDWAVNELVIEHVTLQVCLRRSGLCARVRVRVACGSLRVRWLECFYFRPALRSILKTCVPRRIATRAALDLA